MTILNVGTVLDVGPDASGFVRGSEPVHQAAQMCRKRGSIVLVGVTGVELSRADFYAKELSFQASCSYGPGQPVASGQGEKASAAAFVQAVEQGGVSPIPWEEVAEVSRVTIELGEQVRWRRV